MERGWVLLAPLCPFPGNSSCPSTSCPVTRDPEVNPPQEQYICDPSAVLTLGTLDVDSPQALWAHKLAEERKLYVCSSDLLDDMEQDTNTDLQFKVWEPITYWDLATPEVVDMLASMTGVTEVYDDPCVYESVVALLQAHSAKHDSPRGLRRLVTDNQHFWEVFLGTEEKQEKTRWAMLTAGGGKQLIEVIKLWELDFESYQVV